MSNEKPDFNSILSKNEMIKWLYSFLKSKRVRHLTIKQTSITGKEGCKYYCFRCTILQEYIKEMSRIVKVGVLGNIHDSFIVFLNHFITHSSYKSISLKDVDGIFKDLIVKMVRYEQKTAIDIDRDKFGSFVRKYFFKVLDSFQSKDIWWFVSLYKIDERKLPKNIKYPVCSYYLVCMSLDTKAANLKRHSDKSVDVAKAEEIEADVNASVEMLLKTVEKEDGFPEGIIYPVKNTIVVEDLRKQLKEEERKRKEEERKRKEIEEKNQIYLQLLKNKGISEDEIKEELEKRLNK
jgi:hypothetical protein